MRKNVFLALLLSVFLMGVASWSRFSRPTIYQADLVPVDSLATSDYVRPMSTGSSSTTATYTPPEKLTTTDLVSRQIVLDYLALASEGQATESNLLDLVNQRVEAVPSPVTVSTVDESGIQVVPDSLTAFKEYDSLTTDIEIKRREGISRAYASLKSTEVTVQDSYMLFQKISKYYETAAKELQSIDVPSSIASSHIRLINNFLSSASAMNLLASIEEDSIATLSGLSVLRENSGQEQAIILEISKILVKNGIQP